MCGSSDARLESASSDSRSPGMMAPPTNSSRSLMTDMVVAVPMSTTSSGSGYSWMAATVSATRSAPNEAGLSSLMLSPVFSPGPTTSGFLPVMVRSAVFITLVSGGTTEEIIEPSISLAL